MKSRRDSISAFRIFGEAVVVLEDDIKVDSVALVLEDDIDVDPAVVMSSGEDALVWGVNRSSEQGS